MDAKFEERNKKNECVYCGTMENLTRDHAVPKSFFPEPRPSNLITVPSCRACNESFSLDEEYCLTKLVLRDDLSDHPNVPYLLTKIFRGFEKGKKGRFLLALRRDTKPVDAYSDGGIFLGKRIGYTAKLERIERVVEKIIKSLFFHHQQKRIPADYKISVFYTRSLNPVIAVQAQIKVILNMLASEPSRILGDKVFSYKFRVLDDDPLSSLWVMIFFGKVIFLGMVMPNDNVAQIKNG